MTALYHYTCSHGAADILRDGHVWPLFDVLERANHDGMAVASLPAAQFGWFTDLDVPDRDALGLTNRLTKCDRTKHRFIVTDTTNVRPYVEVRRFLPALWHLEDAPGAMPRHWWISGEPVPVRRDLARGPATTRAEVVPGVTPQDTTRVTEDEAGEPQ